MRPIRNSLACLHNTSLQQLPDISLPSARQHLSYGGCLAVKKEYHQNCSLLDRVTQSSQSAVHLYEQFLQVKQIGCKKLKMAGWTSMPLNRSNSSSLEQLALKGLSVVREFE